MVVYLTSCLYSDMDVDVYMDDLEKYNYWERCPICHGPLEKIYYGGGTHKWECKGCVKHFVTEIYNDPNQ